MTRFRHESTEHLFLLLAQDAEAWPGLFEQAPELLGYLARHGSWHLARVGRVPEAIAFLGRLLSFEARESLLTPSQQSAALHYGLVAVSLCPPEREDEVDGASLATLLLAVQDRSLLRPGCALLARRPLAVVRESFAANPNPSAAAAYVLAEELARRVLARDDREAWDTLAEVAADHEHPLSYAALYAFKYVACERSAWLSDEVVRPFATGGPYDRLAVTTLLLHLALQGDPFPTRFDAPEFWRPTWEYNAEEVLLLKGAMAFRGLWPADDDDPDVAECAEGYRETEHRRLACLGRLGTHDALLRGILEDYWRLTSRLDDLGRLRESLRHHPEAEELVWLLMVSPYWEASEAGSALLARFAALDEAWEARARAWATEDDQTTWWGALVALRLLAERTGREDALFAAIRVQSSHGSAQLRGNCANTLHTLLLAASPERRTALLHTFRDVLRDLLHGEDIWAPNEVLMLLEGLEDEREAWAARLDADAAPLLRHTPEWRELTAEEWGDLLHERLHGEASTPAKSG